MRTMRSLMAAVLAILMIVCMSVSAFAAYEDITYEDVSESFNTTLSSPALLQIKFADSLGIVSGMKNGTFLPEAKITRGEALRIAYRMLHYNYDEIEDYSSVNTVFDENGDTGDVSDVALIKPYVAWALDYQLINSEYVPDSQFKADEYITGEEFIILIKKVCGIFPEAFKDSNYYDHGTFEDLEVNFEDCVFSLAEISAESESINREQAAVAVANAMLYDPEAGTISDDMFTYFEKTDGVALECLATKIYGCDYISLFVRATKEVPLEYEKVTGDMLLSNGVQVTTGMDMSQFVGYPIVILYYDKDGSETYTEDEEMFGYEMQSPMVYTDSLADLTITGNSSLLGTDSIDSYAMFSTVPRYLNGAVWPTDEIYNLANMLPNATPSIGQIVPTRPNLEFKFIKSGSNLNVDLALATEWIPGRVMAVNAKYISVFSYYDNQTYIYEDRNVVYNGTSTLVSGDYINFYDSNGTLYIKAGTTVELSSYEETVDATTGYTSLTGDGNTYLRHCYFNNASVSLANYTGKLTAVLDHTGKTYIALEESRVGKEDVVEVLLAEANADGVTANIEARSLSTGEEILLENVEIARISSATGQMNEGDYFSYYTTINGNINMHGVDPVEAVVIEMDDYFITEGGAKYLKAEGYQSGGTTVNGNATLMVDHYNGVWSVK